eukprot:scaffold4847_cov265-Pinguiococcus_pyrenoidosus.AAC.10
MSLGPAARSKVVAVFERDEAQAAGACNAPASRKDVCEHMPFLRVKNGRRQIGLSPTPFA